MAEDDFYSNEESDPSQDSPEALLHRLAGFARSYLRKPSDITRAALERELDYIEPLFETDDPRANGWVGSDGRP